jgi:D-alanyl-lipoteichoic acid acyltransferase DltB (MBOAT superfamily)
MISSNYLLVLPIVAALFLMVSAATIRWGLLLVVGLLFLLAEGFTSFLIVLALAGLAWTGANLLCKPGFKSPRWLAVLIVLEVLPLLFYKLLKAGLSEAFGGALPEGASDHWLPPLGLSVMTFQAVSYTVDRYREELPSNSWLHYGIYMGFFPHLAAGPILKASDFINQLVASRRVDVQDLQQGLWRIFSGLFKKLVLSDVIAKAGINPVFSDPTSFSSVEILVALLAYTFQIYLDFSAYSDVVIGSARLLGFRLPENFDRPYHAPSIAEYWRRWHMSLSAWVGHYVYRPLGGNRVVTWKIYRNVLVSIVLLAVWHGVTFNFLLYGLIHGTAVCLNRWVRLKDGWVQFKQRHPHMSLIACWGLTFAFVVFARILFKTPTLQDAWLFCDALLHSELSGSPRFSLVFWLCFLGGVLAYCSPLRLQASVQAFFVRQAAAVQGLMFALVLFLGAFLSGGEALQFIYRQF